MITHEIIGDDMQAVIVSMQAGDEIRAEAGAMTELGQLIERPSVSVDGDAKK